MMLCSRNDSRGQGNVDILFYVEDPGAANYIAGLPTALANRGWRACLLAEGLAYPHLLQRGLTPDKRHHLDTAKALLLKIKPRLVLVGTSGNPDTFGFELINTAHDSGIRTIGAVDAFGNADFRFRGRTKNALSHAPELLVVPDQGTKDAYMALGYPSDRITICGHPHYDYVLQSSERLGRRDRKALRSSMFPSNHENAPVVIFGAEPLIELNPDKCHRLQEYTLTGRGNCTTRTEIVIAEFLDAVALLSTRPHLVLRMHPKNKKDDLSSFIGDFHQVSEKGDSLELLYAADLVVGMTSMLLQEAAILGLRTLSIVSRAVEKESLSMIRAGIIPCVSTRAELRATLPNLLIKSTQSAKSAVKKYIQYGSMKKTADFIEGVLAGYLCANPGCPKK